MRYKFLPSFVKRRGRITKYQEKNLTSLEEFRIRNSDELYTSSSLFSKTILEIGFGNGENLIFLAEQHPDTLFIGSEVYLAGIGYLIGEIQERNINNIRIHKGDIRLLIEDVIEPTFDNVLIICPDPWPKARHHKRRLIKSDFLELIHPTIKLNGELFISTDWENYAESIEDVIAISEGYKKLQNSKYENSDLTKFQQRAIEEGRDIYTFSLKKLTK